LVTAYHLLFPDYIQFSDRLKWDGENYIHYALHFPEAAFGQTVNIYYFQRILPSGMVYGVAQLFNIPLTEQKVFYIFLGLNIGLIFISFGIWLLVCKQLNLSKRGKALGFTGLFINFALLKMAFYYPVLTDVMAFTLGLSLLYFYLKQYTVGLLLIGVIGAFTFPTVFYSALLLFIFPVEQLQTMAASKYLFWNNLLAVMSATFFLLLVIIFYYYRDVPLINPAPGFVLMISIAAALAYVYFASRAFYRTGLYLHSIKNFNAWTRASAAIGVLVVVYILLFQGASNGPSPLNYKGFLANIVVSAIANPLTFLVSHAVYLGPVFLVLLYFIKPFIKQVNGYGLGLHLLIVGYVLLSINAETRLFINAWPFFVAFLCKALEGVKLPHSFYIFCLLFALALSKFWYRIDVAYFSENYLNFPEQKYFMSIGPWMSDEMYLLQGAVALVVFFWIYWFYFWKKKLPAVL
jgi:hypothetical protein